MSITEDQHRREAVIHPENRLLLDEVEIAEMLGTSRPTIRKWAKQGLLTPVALPDGMRRKLYTRASVEAFVASLAAKR